MKKALTAVMLATGYMSAAQANTNIDLQCTLDGGDVMTLSHVSDTAYIEFLAPGDDPDEGGSVIKLNAPTGGVETYLNRSADGLESFVLRGTDEDIEGAIAVGYEKNGDKQRAYFSQMNSLGKETGHYECTPGTIKASSVLLSAGLVGLNVPPAASQGTTTVAATQPKSPPVKIEIGQRMSQYGSVRAPYRTVNIVGVTEGLVINKVTVNRNQCSESVGNPKKPISLPFGKTVTYNYSIEYRRCDVVEVVVSTSQGEWVFNPQ
ncbi:hypothetical protein PPUJ20028_46450 [Pseudomonas putida]|uniref:Uncharacterized protein n=1 Tax=Pseudomonas putida TaxID=303 RepID=A0AA37RFP4_PSEPU|nr:hypothetical protein [Pseudomonas putida]GLO16059.1 hypothetical protein PPUJ20028_46450 [Pseudomonas putida]GLO37882.1 hypothetical protein PPUN14671_47190 [Pseudomonas putida]HDS0965093.1 hypothetical protein [Pseudomonas putida]HDS0991475.1 hypothetical protein [Pseudomonas putida]